MDCNLSQRKFSIFLSISDEINELEAVMQVVQNENQRINNWRSGYFSKKGTIPEKKKFPKLAYELIEFNGGRWERSHLPAVTPKGVSL